ncbi:MAG: hypothetical protein GC191_15560 [Azospirillum sp.]|nr:hypothetical protein [Azospirillum sp.]
MALLLGRWAGPAAAGDSQAGVRDAFAAARGALVQGDGAAALGWLSSGTRARLDAIRGAATARGEPALGGRGPIDKIAILGLRRFVPAPVLHGLDGAALLHRVVAEGWLPRAKVEGSALGPVAIQGERAAAVVLVDGKPSLLRAEFVQEDGGWRIDLTRLAAMGDGLLRLFASSKHRSEDDYIAELLDKAGARLAAGHP